MRFQFGFHFAIVEVFFLQNFQLYKIFQWNFGANSYLYLTRWVRRRHRFYALIRFECTIPNNNFDKLLCLLYCFAAIWFFFWAIFIRSRRRMIAFHCKGIVPLKLRFLHIIRTNFLPKNFVFFKLENGIGDIFILLILIQVNFFNFDTFAINFLVLFFLSYFLILFLTTNIIIVSEIIAI